MRIGHIYIVDDDVEDQEIFCQAVGDVDPQINCQIFSSCDEMFKVLAKSLRNLPDIIFLDLNMPKINGKECLSLLKKDSRFENIPIYVYSTTSFAREKEQTLKLGAAGFIVKPNSLSVLKKHLDDILHQA